VIARRVHARAGPASPPRPINPTTITEAPIAKKSICKNWSSSYLKSSSTAQARRHLARTLHRTRNLLAPHLAGDDLTRLDVLTDPDHPESVLHRPDAFMLRATTVHTAVRAVR